MSPDAGRPEVEASGRRNGLHVGIGKLAQKSTAKPSPEEQHAIELEAACKRDSGALKMSLAERHLIDALMFDPDGAIDAADDGTLASLNLSDHACAAVVDAVVDLVAAGRAPLMPAIVELLRLRGWSQADAVDAVLVPGAFATRGCRNWSAGEALANVAAERERHHLELRLVALADRLYRPGGVAHVAALLNREEAA